MLFIPNESVYGFIHEKDSSLLDAALKRKVIWCSPLTLYCVLAVVRQAVENFVLRQTSDEIVSLMGAFNEQWKKFLEKMDSLGNRIQSAQKEFDNLGGTRRRALERPLNRIEELRRESQLPVAVMEKDVLTSSKPDDDSVAVLGVESIETDEDYKSL